MIHDLTPEPHPDTTNTHITQTYKDDYISVNLLNTTFGPYATIARPDGTKIEGVTVILHDGQNILLLKQARPPIKHNIWGLAGGGIDKNETPQQAAVRETLEETGYHITQQNLTHIGTIHSNVSLTESTGHIYYVKITPTHKQTPHTDVKEIIEHKWVPTSSVFNAIKAGHITCSTTITALFKTQQANLI